jgi:DNA-binding NtrC family response regulator
MNAKRIHSGGPFGLIVTGEAETWRPALQRIVGPRWLDVKRVAGEDELLRAVESGRADAAVLDEEAGRDLPALRTLRLIRRIDTGFPVVVVTGQADRRLLEAALRLAAFSVMSKPVGFEALLRQIQRMMDRVDRTWPIGPEQRS